MRQVKTTRDVYETLGDACVSLTESPAAPSLGHLDLVIQYAFRGPDAVITICLTPDLQRTDLGSTNLSPAVTVRAAYAAGQSLMLGELNPFLALDRNELAIEGDVAAFVRAYPSLRRAVSPSVREKLFGPVREQLPAEVVATLRSVLAHPQGAGVS